VPSDDARAGGVADDATVSSAGVGGLME
jgi:hypothetical protein